MNLASLLQELQYEVVQGSVDCDITTLEFDSRKIKEGSVFVCIKGVMSDGHTYAQKALDSGAVALIVEDDIIVSSSLVTIIKVDNSRKALSFMSAAYFDHPARKLKTIGITGTKGKTTTTYMVRSILEKSGYKTGLIGTIETIIGDTVIPANNTTPESYLVQEYFAKMVDAGCDCVVMEVSSQGLMLYRVGGFTFD